ncbi:MAG: HNH endonuclease [Clostridia bacterium]|nr:HNH endonuclease [Clostridia bacterium]
MKSLMFCCYCGAVFERDSRKIKKVNFCSRDCLHSYNREKMSFYNRSTNPMNIKGCESIEQRTKKRNRMLKPTKATEYKKFLGDFEHRRIAKLKIGRDLADDEVVHHIDGDATNNKPSNLQVMTRAEHMRHHIREYWQRKKAGLIDET